MKQNLDAVACRTQCAMELSICIFKNAADNAGGDGSGPGLSDGY